MTVLLVYEVVDLFIFGKKIIKSFIISNSGKESFRSKVFPRLYTAILEGSTQTKGYKESGCIRRRFGRNAGK